MAWRHLKNLKGKRNCFSINVPTFQRVNVHKEGKEEMEKGKYGQIKHFTDIEAWKLGREIRKSIYTLVKTLPNEEKYNLNSQMRRAAISTTANIAEGYGRYHYQENIQFCRQSRGSMYEMQDHLITCLDEGYITKEDYDRMYSLTKNAIRAINGYIKLLQRQQQAERERETENRK
ncbi:S23 ribosomal protein [Candidatus Desulfofervidus auxilii]|uniref:S23 ribosomal protein n=2 Tax=Desulfofervidus auxilii TaxID=1621989 RepID=A0A7U4QIX6_DESA2|nr:S23 ribosomal protein [Candidatus Desulfofervidus auxilii]